MSYTVYMSITWYRHITLLDIWLCRHTYDRYLCRHIYGVALYMSYTIYMSITTYVYICVTPYVVHRIYAHNMVYINMVYIWYSNMRLHRIYVYIYLCIYICLIYSILNRYGTAT